MDSRDIAKHLSKSKNFVYILAKQFDELFDQKYFSRISFCYPELAHPPGGTTMEAFLMLLSLQRFQRFSSQRGPISHET